MAKQLTFDQECREKLIQGVKKLGQAVKITLGPRGLYAVIDRSWGEPKVTTDGSTVAEEVELRDKTENVAARVLRTAAEKTHEEAGDGSTTATVLAETIFLEGAKAVTSGYNPMLLARGIRKAVSAVVEELKRSGKKLEGSAQIKAVATVAAGGDAELGKMISDALAKVGVEGIVTFEEGKSLETELEVVEGMRFDRGYLSPHFVTDQEKMVCELRDPYILIMEEKISNVNQVVPILEKVLKKRKPLLIIAEDVEKEALATLVVNKKDLGLEPKGISTDHLGRARRVIVTNDDTTIVKGCGDKKAIEDRARQIRLELEETTSSYDREKLQERLASLVGGVAQITIGGATESEVKEKKARAESAYEATKAAVEMGILPGGGAALLRAQKVLDNLKGDSPEEERGIEIVRGALEAPIRQLALNAGYEPARVMREVRKAKAGWGFDLVKGELVDMFEAGIIDPVKVVKTALENGASAATMLLVTEAVVTEKPKEKKEKKGKKKRKAPAGMEDYGY